MIIKNLWRRRTRSFLTILGIAIGVAAVVALSTIADAFLQNFGSAVGLNNDLLISQANALDVSMSNLDEDLELRLQNVPGVEEVEPGVYGWITMDEVPFFLVAMQHYRIVEGKPVTGPKQIILGAQAAESMKKNVEDKLRINGVPYEIVGIYETGQGMEESGGVVILEDAQDIVSKQREVSLFQLGLARGVDIEQVVERIESLDDDIVATISSEYEVNETYAAMLDGFAMGVAAIAVIIGGLGMMNAMVMSVLERTREIGTLRAVGWGRWRVMQMIVGETLLLSFIGGIVGILLGIGLSELAAAAPGVGGLMQGSYSMDIMFRGMMTALLLGLVGGVYPAWVAANLQPVEALRYEGGAADSTGGRLSHVGSQSFRNLWRRRTRTIISATGIGIGVATLVALGGMMAGMTQSLNGLAGSSGTGNISLMQRDVGDMSMSSVDERIVAQIQAMPQVKSVSAMLMGFIMTPDLPLFIIFGLDPNSEAMEHYQLREGRQIHRPNEMLIGKGAAETYSLSPGDTMTVFDNRYKVVGIFETGVGYEDGSGLLAMREEQRLLNRPRTASFVFIDVEDPKDAEAVVATIDRRFPDVRASLSSEFAQNTADMQSGEAMMDGIGFLAMLVGAIVVANTMMMSIYERTREIGTLRALGWRKSRILRQIVEESLLLCLIAGILGSFIGILLMQLMTAIPGYGGMLGADWSADIFINAIVLALIIGLIAGAYPAWRASRLQPVEALRYE